MKSRTRSILLLSLLAVLAGCASTEVTQQTPTVKETITRPNQIWIYDFGAMPGDVPSDYSARHDAGGEITSLTDTQIVTDRRLGGAHCERPCRRYSIVRSFGCAGNAGIVTTSRRQRNPRIPGVN
jgi:hypothetical protein